jgi:hypothetical protein
MPDSHDNASEPPVRLPWESIDEEAVEKPPAEAPGDLDALAAVVAERSGADAPDGGGDGNVELLDYAEAGDGARDLEAVDYERPVPAEPVEEDLGPPPRGGGWTVAVLCAGICLIACCVIIPQADANRRLVYEREKLKIDLESIREQVTTNDEFLRRVADDPNLAERLAQRQMKIIREGTRVLELKQDGAKGGAGGGMLPTDVSPFHLVAVAPPPPMPPYEPNGGRLARLCYDPHKRLYLMGTGLFLMAAGLVCGFGPRE